MNRLTAVLALLWICGCGAAKYEVNPDGSRPVLYPADKVLNWEVVDHAYQSPAGDARIYIDPTVRFDKDVLLGNGVEVWRARQAIQPKMDEVLARWRGP